MPLVVNDCRFVDVSPPRSAAESAETAVEPSAANCVVVSRLSAVVVNPEICVELSEAAFSASSSVEVEALSWPLVRLWT